MDKFVQLASEFFAMNIPNPAHWTSNSSFGAFGPFHYCTNFGAKLEELVQLKHKFVP
jgi:hypothetical protein